MCVSVLVQNPLLLFSGENQNRGKKQNNYVRARVGGKAQFLSDKSLKKV